MQPAHTTVDIETVVRQVIEEVTGNLVKDIRPDSDLVEDLGISQSELLKIIVRCQAVLEIVISEEARREIIDEAEYVSDLVEIIEDEYEF